jgi:putative ABC transport system substrate-binding protein
MRRRHFVALASAAALPVQAQTVPRIGFLAAGDPEPTWTLFRKAMADLGYVEGRTVTFEFRAADAASGRLDEFAVELVRLNVDVIVPVLSPAIAAAKRATSKIPIVFNGGAPDTGMVSNVARTEGNLTGVFSPSSTLAGKGIQLFHEIKPNTKVFGVFLNALDPFHVPLQREVETVGRAERIELLPVMIKSRDELPQAFEALARRGVDGVLVQPSLGLQATAALALKYRLAAISFRREFAEAGGLLSCGADQVEVNRAVAGCVDKILKGARPADLPVQQASRVELIVNQKTARVLGIALSPMFLARVDEVIE